MEKRFILATAFLTLFALVLVAGCGGGEDAATQAEKAADEAPAAEDHPAAEAVAGHDCAGGCGMKNWPEDQMTEINGKWYCAGCAKKAQTEDESQGDGDG